MLNEPSGISEVVSVSPSRPVDDLRSQLRAAVDEVFFVESESNELPRPITASYSGRLLMDSETAYEQLDRAFQKLDHIPVFLPDGERQTIRAIRGRFHPRPRPTWPNVVLLICTVLSLMYVGMTIELGRFDLTSPFDLLYGWPYALGLMLILGAHELGHYFMARHHHVSVTLPYFIPMPLSPLGTMGAFIQLREPMRNRRVLLDIGAAGPIAGLIFAIPVLLIGLKTSPVHPLPEMDIFMLRARSVDYAMEGNSILYAGAKLLVFGRFLPDGMNDVTPNQLAWAGWTGLLVTALNLIPIGQLDGGHTIYSLLGERARMFYLPSLALLGVLSVLDQTWLIWLILLLLLGRIYATPLDMITRLDRRRQIFAIFTLIVFILVFLPFPLQEIRIG